MRHIEKMICRLGKRSSDLISNVALSMGKKAAIWPKSAYKNRLEVPFEFLKISIPIGYHERLRIEYGEDYMIPKFAPTAHGNCIFDTDVPFGLFDIKQSHQELSGIINGR